MSDSRSRRGRLRPDAVRLRGERGVAFLPELVIAFLMTIVVATAVVRNIWEAHRTEDRIYARGRVLEELQAEMEYWKAQLLLNGPRRPTPNARHTVVLDARRSTDNRKWTWATFDPAPVISQITLPGANAYEITVSVSWPEDGHVYRETLKTAVNQVR